ncbi:MAG: PP2C family protein-serine/threonine phosphatase [Candidatus Latescibacteria bacterium]|jgi:phosphoserine phosphatase RsbU/P|nr:PP2C family protein-serine/threonine phosphatase [Candidatus Latescibacterota bacterium]
MPSDRSEKAETIPANRRGPSRRSEDRNSKESYLKAIERSGNLAKLVEITAFMNSTIVLEDLLTRIMAASKRVANAEAGSLFLLDSDSCDLMPYIIEGGAGGELKALPPLKKGHGIAGWVAQSGESELIDDAYEHPKFDPAYDKKTGYRTRSMICVPIVSNQVVIGVSQVINRINGERFNKEDLALFEAFCIQAAIAIQNARMHEALLTRQRLEQDLQFATTIQQSFLPQHAPDITGFSFATTYISAQEVGGDFFDYIEFPDNRIGVLVGDVSGKGVPAALYMARLMSDFRVIALSEHIPTRVVSRVNNMLVERSRRGMFVTLLYILIEIKERLITVINAGHLPPLMRRGIDGKVVALDETGGCPLGILPDANFQAQCFPIEQGDMILAYTDGVMEARSASKEEFGLERLSDILEGGPESADGMIQAVQRELLLFTGNRPSHDDLTMLCMGVE